MKITFKEQTAFTVIELLIVIVIIVVLAGMLRPSFIGNKAPAERIHCVSNLKEIGMGYRMFGNDHDGLFPNDVSTNQGGAKGGLPVEEIFKCLGLSNELISTKILVCPADEQKVPATNLSTMTVSNLSYFACLNARETNVNMLLGGDRNLTLNGISLLAFTVKTNDLLGWTAELHNLKGNIGLADGSVQQCASNKLTEQMKASGTIHRLSLP